MTNRTRRHSPLIVLLAAVLLSGSPQDRTGPKPPGEGDRIVPFTLPRQNGGKFTWKGGKALILVFVEPNKKQSERALRDLGEVLDDLAPPRGSADTILVTTDKVTPSYFKTFLGEVNLRSHFLLDRKLSLWTRFRVKATPTLVLADRSGRITWIHAGHGYYFPRELYRNLKGVLGSPPGQEETNPTPAGTLDPHSPEAKALRHLETGRQLASQGLYSAGLKEVALAAGHQPQTTGIKVTAAFIHNLNGDGAAALKALSALRPAGKKAQARILMLTGWAQLLIGRVEEAEKALTAARSLHPESTRTAYLLGRVLETRGRKDEALRLYRSALDRHLQAHIEW